MLLMFDPHTIHQLTINSFVLTHQVGKTRYGEHVNVNVDFKEERDKLLVENNILRNRIALLEKGCPTSPDSIRSAFEMLQQNIVKVCATLTLSYHRNVKLTISFCRMSFLILGQLKEQMN